jgi:hypothetical protein
MTPALHVRGEPPQERLRTIGIKQFEGLLHRFECTTARSENKSLIGKASFFPACAVALNLPQEA